MKHRTLLTAEEICGKVEDLATKLDSAGVDSYLVLTVLKGAAIFCADLVRAMRTPTEIEYITASSYVNGFTPGDSLRIDQTPLDAAGRHVLIVEDIIDTGRTLEQLHARVLDNGPSSITTVTLVNKTNRRATTFEPDHYGFTITDEFIYGYGLDWNQQYRDLPYIAIADPDGIRT